MGENPNEHFLLCGKGHHFKTILLPLVPPLTWKISGAVSMVKGITMGTFSTATKSAAWAAVNGPLSTALSSNDLNTTSAGCSTPKPKATRIEEKRGKIGMRK